MAKGILIASMNMANAAEDEFHDWYDTEHLPERVACPGFLRCQRWRQNLERIAGAADLLHRCAQAERNQRHVVFNQSVARILFH